mmetsp:Transcript_7093/g.11687  ORF Transcript_7093/g.11687 Transcript_7093/m.11687 type:complete len:328 (-) Transcript_7093:112-1095(-)
MATELDDIGQSDKSAAVDSKTVIAQEEFSNAFRRIDNPLETFTDPAGWGKVRISWTILTPLTVLIFGISTSTDEVALDYVGAILFVGVTLYSLLLSWNYYTDWRKSKAIQQLFFLDEAFEGEAALTDEAIDELSQRRDKLEKEKREFEARVQKLRKLQKGLGGNVKELKVAHQKCKTNLTEALDLAQSLEDLFVKKLEHVQRSCEQTVKNNQISVFSLINILINTIHLGRYTRDHYDAFLRELNAAKENVFTSKEHLDLFEKGGVCKWSPEQGARFMKTATLRKQIKDWLTKVNKAIIERRVQKLEGDRKSVTELGKRVERELKELN